MDDPVIRDPEIRLACLYAPAPARSAFAALWALDAQFADLLRAAHDPVIGQLRFTWWHDALSRLDDHPPPAQPLLQMLGGKLVREGLSGAALAAMIDGWEMLLDAGPIDDAALILHGEARGARLFALAALLLGASPADPVAAAGRGWALIDLGLHLSDPDARARCFSLASPLLEALAVQRWSRAGRPLGMLARLAIIDLRRGPDIARRQGSPWRLLQMLRHRVTGR